MKLDQLKKLLPNKEINLVININGEKPFVRIINTSSKIKKFFNRTFGTDVVTVNALQYECGLLSGTTVLSMDKFVDILTEIDKFSLFNRSVNAIKRITVTDLNDINWKDLPLHNRRVKSEVRRHLMAINHAYLRENNVTKIEDLNFSALPVQGFKEKEVIKFFDN